MYSERANKNNNLGLYMHDSKLYSLLGFFHPSCGYESGHKSIKGLPWTSDYIQDYHFRNHFEHWTPISNDHQLLHFGLKPKDHIILHGFNSCSFVFKRYKKELPFSQLKNVTKSFEQALFDYVEANKIIKLIATPHRIIKALKMKEDGIETQYNYFVDKALLKRSFERVFHKTSYGMETDKLDTSIYPKEDKKEISASFDYTYEENVLSDNIINAAKLKGGFVPYNYKNIDYNIPLLPLLAWANDCKDDTFDFYLWTWIFNNESPLKTLILGSKMAKSYISNTPKDLISGLMKLAQSINEDDYFDDDD